MSGNVRCPSTPRGLQNHGGSGGARGAHPARVTGNSASASSAVGARSTGSVCWIRNMTGRKPLTLGDARTKVTSFAEVRAISPPRFETAARHVLCVVLRNYIDRENAGPKVVAAELNHFGLTQND